MRTLDEVLAVDVITIVFPMVTKPTL